MYKLVESFASPAENDTRQSSNYSGCSLLGHTELILSTPWNTTRLPINNSNLIEKPVFPYTPKDTSLSASQVQASGGSHACKNIELQNVPITTQYILLEKIN